MKGIKYYALCIINFALFFALSGCVEEFEADIPDDDSDLLVVEGSICSSQMNKFILSRTQSLNTSVASKPVIGAMVYVRGSDGSEYLAQPTAGNYGYFSCWIDDLNPDVEYWLHIETNGEIYESEPQKPLRTEGIADVTVVQNTPDSNIDVLVTPDAPFDSNKANYYSWTCDETWEVHSDYTTNMYFDIETMMRMYQAHLFPDCGWKDATNATIMVGASSSYEGQHIQRLKMYDIDCSNERVFYMYSGLIHQRAITKAEYEYELAREQAGSEMGGLFTPQPSALPTNIHCLTSNKHVIGYVGCSLNTSEYRFFLDADDFSIHYPEREDTRLWIDNCDENVCKRMVEKGMFLCEWEDNRVSGGTLHTAWAFERQLDVRYKGAYIERPDFWPEEEDEE
ncbi:MAG: DUF4249 domain-containing protein [Prevotella sp.]|nr:DUF4249 domain-containing protein [Prevotella sp.]